MATRAPKKPVTMCCVTIDYNDFILPADQGMRLVELMQQAMRCREEYVDGRIYVLDAKPLDISMAIIRPSQVRPAPSNQDDRRAPLLLGSDS